MNYFRSNDLSRILGTPAGSSTEPSNRREKRSFPDLSDAQILRSLPHLKLANRCATIWPLASPCGDGVPSIFLPRVKPAGRE
jgi:hypothetical protein